MAGTIHSPPMRLGDLELTVVGDGEFGLDGGAMFGVVPKVLWEKVKPPDALNRIRMATNCLLVERGSDLLLVDSGIGDKHDARFRANYAMDETAERLPDSIWRAGYEPEDVTHVLLSHLHFDHCGWNTRYDGGTLVPTFPRARYWLERGEVEHARAPNERDRASYDPRNWEPLFEAGVVELFDGEAEPMPGRPRRQGAGAQRRHVHRAPGRRRRRARRLLGRPRPHRRPRPLSLDHGLRPLPPDHPGDQEAVAAARRAPRGGSASSSTTPRRRSRAWSRRSPGASPRRPSRRWNA